VDCGVSIETDITVQAADACGNIASKTIPILIDDNTPPATDFTTNILESVTTKHEPNSFIDVLLELEAPDNCGGRATNDTVEVHSNEINNVRSIT
jgi:hypothetical protein